MTRTIVIKGKRITCRKLRDNEVLRDGDISYRPEAIQCDGVGYLWHGRMAKTYNDEISVAYRPISKPTRKPRPSKGKAVKRGVKIEAIRAWALVKKDNKIYVGSLFVTKSHAEHIEGIGAGRHCIPVLITPLRRERHK